MVAKMIKKSPRKSIKRWRKKSSPGKGNGVISAVQESLVSCRRRLGKMFSKLARISSTPSKKNKQRKLGFRKMKPLCLQVEPQLQEEEEDDDEERKLGLSFSKLVEFGLPPPLDPLTRTIFLDLDETLIHSSPDPPPLRFDFVVTPIIDGEPMNFYVLKRPGVDQLLEFLSNNRFEIVVFTAALRDYASLVLDNLDKNRLISHRLYRDSCTLMDDGRFVKDLSQFGRDLKRLLIVDDNPTSYAFQPHNAIQIRPFVNDLHDTQLSRLIHFFHRCEGFLDLREAIRVFAPLNLQS